MTGVTWTCNQLAERDRFAEAVVYARSIISDPAQKTAYKARLEPGKRVFNAAIAEYMRKPAPSAEPTMWIADASGARPYISRQLSTVSSLNKRKRKTLRPRSINTSVVLGSVKRALERRIAEQEAYKTMSEYTIHNRNNRNKSSCICRQSPKKPLSVKKKGSHGFITSEPHKCG